MAHTHQTAQTQETGETVHEAPVETVAEVKTQDPPAKEEPKLVARNAGFTVYEKGVRTRGSSVPVAPNSHPSRAGSNSPST